jgi:DNA-binding protein H-NS
VDAAIGWERPEQFELHRNGGVPTPAARGMTKEFVVKSIRSMTFKELIKTKVEIEATIFSLMQAEQSRQLKKAMSAIEAIASASADRSKGPRGQHPLKGRSLPVRFRNPKNRKETWAGRGLKPRWLVAALKGKKNKLADFAVG